MDNQINIQLCYNYSNIYHPLSLKMAQITYADVLQYLGLENWQFIGLALLLLAVWSVLVVLYKMGAIRKVQQAKTILFRGSLHKLWGQL